MRKFLISQTDIEKLVKELQNLLQELMIKNF